jgi:hypothetical protein
MATEVLLGSTAQAILQNAVLPILLVRLEITEEKGGRRCRVICEDMFQHILFRQIFRITRSTRCCTSSTSCRRPKAASPCSTCRTRLRSKST